MHPKDVHSYDRIVPWIFDWTWDDSIYKFNTREEAQKYMDVYTQRGHETTRVRMMSLDELMVDEIMKQ